MRVLTSSQSTRVVMSGPPVQILVVCLALGYEHLPRRALSQRVQCDLTTTTRVVNRISVDYALSEMERARLAHEKDALSAQISESRRVAAEQGLLLQQQSHELRASAEQSAAATALLYEMSREKIGENVIARSATPPRGIHVVCTAPRASLHARTHCVGSANVRHPARWETILPITCGEGALTSLRPTSLRPLRCRKSRPPQ